MYLGNGNPATVIHVEVHTGVFLVFPTEKK